MKVRALCLLLLVVSSELLAARKDFKGLFGSYRREKFTENEGNDTDWGFDVLMSTLLPITSVANSTENTAAGTTPMSYATFFNVEGNIFFTMSYNWELFLNLGFYSYETRRQNTTSSTDPDDQVAPGTPQFHKFNMEAIPLLIGAKYRFSRTDIVPYFGAGAGLAYVYRRGGYDYSPASNQHFSTVFAAQVTGGIEFFISPHAGIRLEASAMYMGLSEVRFDTGGIQTNFPVIDYMANPIALRYASGVFFLF